MFFDLKNIPKPLYIIASFFLVSSIISGIYVLEVFTSFLLLIILFGLFYRINEAPVVVFALSFQWLSISISHIYLIFVDSNQKELLWRPFYSLEYINQTYWLSIVSLFAFALGIKFAIRSVRIKQISTFLLNKYDTFKVIILYVVFSVLFTTIANQIRFIIPGIFQAMVILNFFKWSLFFLMIYTSLKKNEHKKIVFTIIFVEFILGFSGIFAEFQDFLILFPIVYLSFNKIQGRKQIIILTMLAIILINIGAIWSYVKVEYRMFLSGGERAQIIVVDKNKALNKLWELTTKVNAETYKMGFEALIKRIYSLEYFSATINHSIKYDKYLEGETWENAIKHVLMPRILFPNKGSIDDSKQTMKLTGIQMADASQGTSISVGYMAESFADFGSFFMHFAIFMLGFLLGSIYRLLTTNAINSLWAFAMVFPMYFLININGRNLIKIFGHTFYFIIVFFFLTKFIVPIIDKNIKKTRIT